MPDQIQVALTPHIWVTMLWPFARAVDRRAGEHAGEQRAHRAGDAVHAEGVETIVVAEQLLQPHRPGVTRRPTGQADYQRALRIDEAGGRRDGHQTGHRARGQAKHAGLFAFDPLDHHPS